MFKREKIIAFDRIRLKISGMRLTEVYEIVCRDDGAAELSQYYVSYENHEDKLNLIKRTVCPAKEILELLNNCGILRWDGFRGPNPRGVRDGYMFDFTAQVNGDRTVCASGSNNYPRHYHELTDAFRLLLQDATAEG